MERDIIKTMDDLEQKSEKKPPYPLESLGEDLSNLAFTLAGIREKIKLANKNAVITKKPHKLDIAKNMSYKVKAMINIADACVKDFERLKF